MCEQEQEIPYAKLEKMWEEELNYNIALVRHAREMEEKLRLNPNTTIKPSEEVRRLTEECQRLLAENTMLTTSKRRIREWRREAADIMTELLDLRSRVRKTQDEVRDGILEGVIELLQRKDLRKKNIYTILDIAIDERRSIEEAAVIFEQLREVGE